MSFLYEYSGWPRRPVPGDPGPFPRFHARLAEAETLLAWGVAEEPTADGRPAGPEHPDGPRRERPPG